MHFGQYSYVVTTILFAGGAVIIEYCLAFKTLWRFRRVVAAVVLIGLIGTAFAERIALNWELWAYNPERTLKIFVSGAALETYLFSVLVSIAVSSATLYWVYCEDRGLSIVGSTYENIKERVLRLLSRT